MVSLNYNMDRIIINDIAYGDMSDIYFRLGSTVNLRLAFMEFSNE